MNQLNNVIGMTWCMELLKQYYWLIFLTSNLHLLLKLQSWRPNFANQTRTLRLIYFMLLLCDLNWAGQLIACTRKRKVSLRYGQIDALLRKMTSISSNLIGQILVCFQYRPITYLYVSQMEIIFRLDTIRHKPGGLCLGRLKLDDLELVDLAGLNPTPLSSLQTVWPEGNKSLKRL